MDFGGAGVDAVRFSWPLFSATAVFPGKTIFCNCSPVRRYPGRLIYIVRLRRGAFIGKAWALS
jgi:hypothetical protein